MSDDESARNKNTQVIRNWGGSDLPLPSWTSWPNPTDLKFTKFSKKAKFGRWMIIATRLAALFRRSSAKMLMPPLASLCQGCLFSFHKFHLMSLKRSYHDHVMFKSYAFPQLEVVSQLLWLNSPQFSHDWFCCSLINENSSPFESFHKFKPQFPGVFSSKYGFQSEKFRKPGDKCLRMTAHFVIMWKLSL